MVDIPISKLTEGDALAGDELAIVSQKSSTITIAATTISALASDQSFNDSGDGFLAAGFLVGDYVNVSGFTGDVANNILSAEITVITAGKMTIGGSDGAAIVDDAAGESVTISKWVSRRSTSQEIADLAAGGASEASASEIWTGSETGKYISPDKLFDAAAPTTLASSSNATAVDMATGINFNLPLDEDSEISNPTNAKAGQSGRIRVTDDGTGGWDLTFAANWTFIGSDPTPITTVASEEHLFAYFVNGTSDIELSYLGALV